MRFFLDKKTEQEDYLKGVKFAQQVFVKDNRHLINLYNSARNKWLSSVGIDEHKENFWQGCSDYYRGQLKAKKLLK